MSLIYKDFKIVCSSTQFKLFGPIKDKKIEIPLLRKSGVIEKFVFHIPVPQSSILGLTANLKRDMAIKEIKKMIDGGLENNKNREFELVSGKFEEITNV